MNYKKISPLSLNALILVQVICAPLLGVSDKPSKSREDEKTKEILSAYERQLKENPKNLQLFYALGSAYYSKDNYKKALSLFEQAYEIDPNYRDIKRRLGLTYLFLHRLEKAEEMLEQALVLAPEDEQTLIGLARIAQLQYNFEKAERYYDQVLELNPQDISALTFYGDMLLQQKRFGKAMDVYGKLLAIRPDDKEFEIMFTRAKLGPVLEEISNLIAMDKQQEAIERYRNLIDQHPQSEQVYLAIGSIYKSLGRYSDAINLYERGLTLLPNSTSLQTAIALTWLAANYPEKAKPYLEKVLEEDPQNVSALAGLGRMYVLLGHPKKGNEYYEKALEIRPYDETALNFSAEFALEQKNFSHAHMLFQRLLKIHPESEYLWRMIDKAEHGPLIQRIEQLEEKGENIEDLYLQLVQKASDNPEYYLLFGRYFMDRHQYKRAQDVYNKSLKQIPNETSLLVAAGFAYLLDGNLGEAESYFEQVLRQDPNNSDSLAGMGRIYELDGNSQEAEKYYLKSLEFDHDNITALSFLANLRVKQQRYGHAERLYEKIQKEEPELDWPKKAMDWIKYRKILDEIRENQEQGDLEGTEILYRQLILTAPENIDYYIGLGRLFQENRRYDDAIELYNSALEQHPLDPLIKTALANAYLSTGKWDRAEQLLLEAGKISPNDPEILAAFGKIAEHQGNNRQALAQYLHALESDPENITALSYLGNYFFTQKKYDKALDVYMELKTQLPDSAWLRQAIIDIYNAPLLDEIQSLLQVGGLSDEQKEKRELEAESLYRKLLQKSSKNPRYYLQLGQLYAQMRRFTDAIQTYKSGLRYDPDNRDLLTYLGFALIFNNDLNRAKVQFNKVIKTYPNFSDGWAGLGKVAQEEGNASEAEFFYEHALDLDPQSKIALIYSANFYHKQGLFSKAHGLYERLLQLEPNSLWVERALQEIDLAPQLEQVRLLELEENWEEAAAIYAGLQGYYEKDIEYFLHLGNLYIRMKQFGRAIEVYQNGIASSPSAIRLKNALGLAYLFAGDHGKAETQFEEVLAIDPNNGEAMGGLGQVASLLEDPKRAERLFKRSLSISPDDTTILSFYGDLLMKQKRYEEAAELFERLVKLDPTAQWARNALQNAENGPLAEGARIFDILGHDRQALQSYVNLIGRDSDNSTYYLYLGDLYAKQERFWDAIRIYQIGLEAEPGSPALYRAIGFAYVSLEEICQSERIFTALIAKNPEDAAAWAGLGRTEALKGHYRQAECYYAKALEIDPADETADVYFAADLSEKQNYFSATRLYLDLAAKNPNKQWLSERVDENWRKTRDKLTFSGGYYEEDEWNREDDEWAARYQVYGGAVKLESPINDKTWFDVRVRNDFYRLTDRLNDETLYFFNSTGAYVGGKRLINSCYYVEGALGVTAYAPYKRAQFNQARDVVFEPTLSVTYHKRDEQFLTVGISSDTELVARDFEENDAKLVTRYYTFGTWRREFFNELILGAEGGWYWLTDYQRNDFQRAAVSLNWRPECFFKNISLLYYFQFQNFDKVIPDYWTYAPQLVNHLQIEYKRDYNEITSFTLGYAHGWQSSRTRFAEIIVTEPPVLQPLFWDRREYNTGFVKIDYDACPFKFTAEGSYYRDTKRYTIWFGKLDVQYEF